jgi:hypothetical protein
VGRVGSAARVIATDRRIGVDLAMVLEELRVQAAASVEVSRAELTNVHWGILASAVRDVPQIAGSII